MKFRNLLLALSLCCASSMILAQEFRATLTGRVTDPTGAILPNATIVVTNTATGTKVETKSDSTGQYTTPFLLPGPYSVRVTASGFRTYEHKNLTLQTGAKVQEDVPMQLGEENQSVVVTTETPLIETTTATAGQVLSAQEIENLPANGRSPLGLAKTEYGVVPKQKNSVVQSRPFDNSASSDFSIGGGNSQSNEYLLNGVPNSQDSSRLPGFSPMQDSVQEIRVDVFESDASYGDTSGGTVNLTTKAGTNRFHGAFNEFNQFSAINAPTRWFANSFPATRQNQYGAYLSGPVLIPKLFDGHNKLFFLYAYEGFKGSTPNPITTTVPTQAERAGDFSGLLSGQMVSSQNCSAGQTYTYDRYQLFDPTSGKVDPKCPGQVVRTPFANNKLPQINSVAAAYLNFFPLPNTPASAADGENNFRSNVPTTNDYNSHSGRLDYNINDSNKIFFETHRSEYLQTSNNIFNNIATGSQKYTVYQGGLVDYVHSFSPIATLDARLSLTRSYNNTTLPSQGFDASSIGYPGYINTNASTALPRVAFTENGTTDAPSYSTLSTKPGTLAAFDTIQFFSAFTLVHGKHTIKVGPDIRQNKNNVLSPGYSSGDFEFDNSFVSAGSTLAGPQFGGSFASFLLGTPKSGSYQISPALTYNNWYFGGFVQDDWRALPNLTLNMGLRVESETSINESQNRAVVGWDSTATNSATAGAVAAYAAHPIPELPASAFSPTGGLQFASASRRYEYATPAVYLSPRFGFSYTPEALRNRGVIRGGFGIFVNPFNNYYNPASYGFSSTSNLVPTTDNYLSPASSLSDPFPAGTNPLVQPTGSSLGVNTFLGQDIQVRPSKVQVPYSQRWNLDFQYQLSKNTSIDIGYIGNHQVHLSYTNCLSCINQLPFLSHSPRRDTAVQSNLSSSVTNPFRGLPNVTGSLASSKTIQKLTLLGGYPEYNSVNQQLTPGASSIFNQLLVRFQQRMSHGLTLNVNYQYSKQLIAQQLNKGGPLTYQESSSDYTHHISITGVYQLPFGHNQMFLNHMSGLLDQLVSGFTVNTIYAYLSGAPIAWGNTGSGNYPLFADGTAYDSSLHVSPRAYTGSFDKTRFDTNPNDQPNASYNYRTFPLFYGRQDATNNLDASVLKNFHAGDRFQIQYRFEAFNVLNHTQFGTPNVSPTSGSFSTITSQANTPRVLQQGLRVVF